MKGIILAGGSGSRLWPATQSFSKQLLPVYDKPMIYYPLSTLMLAGIREVLIITTPNDQDLFKKLLGNGFDWGINIKYEIQFAPKGLAEALIIAENFLENESCLMILGDNVFYGIGLGRDIVKVLPNSGAHIFTYEVSNPSDYGVVELDEDNKVLSIFEKPAEFISNFAVTGLYFFDNKASNIAKNVKPSKRGELEITSVINSYLELGLLTCTKLSRGIAWLDTGNFSSMNDASNYVRIIEDRTGLKIACLEEIALLNGWITKLQLHERIKRFENNSYSNYLKKLIS
jgi:glucose-1-phosphate thymidylyltransferase